ncbi:MAG: tetratricopeptide repeat protein [Terriglobia bacterium]
MRLCLPIQARFLGGLLLVLLARAPAAAETVLVLPFENESQVAGLEWVGESFAESLTERLAGEQRFSVTREERLAALQRLGLPATAPLSRAGALRLAEEVEADRVVLGEFNVADGQLLARAHLLDVRRLHLAADLDEEGPFEGLLSLQGRIAWRILRQLDSDFAATWEEFDRQFPLLPVSAFESYVRGRLALNPEQQKGYFLQATRIAPGYGAPAFRLAKIYFEDDDFATAARWFAKVPGDDSLGLDARFYLALCHFFQGDFAHSREILAPLAERLPVAPVWNNLGVFASREQAGAKAVEFFTRARQADPSNADLAFNLGLHYLRREQFGAAARALAEGVELNPGDTEGLFLYARALEQSGRTEDAARVRHQAVGDNPALDLSLEHRQLKLDRLERNFSARLARLNQQRDPPPSGASARGLHVAVHLRRGEGLVARGLLEQARQEFIEAVVLDPDAYQAHLALANIYERQQRPADAIAELKAALWSQETLAARLRLAALLLQQNRYPEARHQVAAALALDPDNEEARALEGRLPAQVAETQPEEGEKQ